jgi:hypothetical protein
MLPGMRFSKGTVSFRGGLADDPTGLDLLATMVFRGTEALIGFRWGAGASSSSSL